MLPMVQSEPVLFKCGVHSVNTATTPPTTLPPSLTPESDVDELVDIFFDVDVAATTYPRIESCDLQLGDTWRGMQGKMSVTTPDKKIRKKSDKPQSQINKCHNEKKRREQENETINQLEELLGTCLAEVKQPDKNGIVREATRKIQEVLQRRRECPGECPLRLVQALSPVQAGEVSSTQPQVPLGVHYSEITTFIEALKHYTAILGWTLLEINCKGEIECVTENIKDLVLRDRAELHKKSIYSIIHVKDHSKLKPLLRSIQSFSWTAGDSDKFQAIQAGLIVKNSNGTDTSVVEAIIHAAPVRSSGSEEPGSVMCVIRRCEDASAALIPVAGAGGPPAIHAKNADHIVFRLDCNTYTVLSCDLSGVENYLNAPGSVVGARYLDLVESCDRGRVAANLSEAACLPAPPAISDPFRIHVRADGPPVLVSARSRLFRAKPPGGEPDFIMSTLAVLDDDSQDDPHPLPPNTPAPATTPALPNGDTDADRESDANPRYRHQDGSFSMNDFDLDPWAASLLGDMPTGPKERKDNSSGEGSSTPRAPSTPAEALSPLQHHHSQHQHTQHQHHPQPQHSQQQHSQQQHSQQQHSQQQHSQQQHLHQQHEEPTRLRSILTSKNNILIDMLRQEDEEGTGGETSAPHTPRTPQTPVAPLTPLTPAAQSPVHMRPQHSHLGLASHSHLGPASHSLQQPNPLVARMLNDSTDEDIEDSRRGSASGRGGNNGSSGSSGSGMGHQSVLSKLLQTSNNGRPTGDSQESAYLEKMTQKRKFDEGKVMPPNAKRATPEHQVSSSAASVVPVPASSSSPATSGGSGGGGGGMSSLCQKNQILVSLLAREQSTPATPPQLANPGVRHFAPRARAPHPPATQQPPPSPHHLPHHHPHHGPHPLRHHSALSDILTGNNHRMGTVNGGAGPGHGGAGGNGGGASSVGSHLANMLTGAAPPGRYPPPHYAPHNPHPAPHPAVRAYAQPHHHQQQQQQQQQQPHHHLHNANLRVAAGSGDSEVPSPDKTLSDILDDILVTMPDPEQHRQENEDKNAVVHAITQSLMQCEKERTKHPIVSSPGTPPVYSVQSPTSGCPMPSASSGMYGSRPSPGPSIAEQHARLLHMQRSQQMLVSPEAAEQPQSDLGSTINALVTETPPNVTLLPRGDYHTNIYQSNQMGSNYGTIKTSSQQNPMLSRQLSVGGSGGYAHNVGGGGAGTTHAAAALHTPMTPQPYHRAPRPHLVGGYYEESGAGVGGGAGECGEYARCTPLPPHAPHPPHLPHPYRSPGHMHCPGNGSPGVAGGGGTGGGASGISEYVRNELQAVVGARSARPDLHPLQPPNMDSLMSFDIAPPGGGTVVGGRAASASSSWETQQSTPAPNTTEAVSAEAAAAAGGDEGAAGGAGGGGAGGAGSTVATTKSSLLQKLLSQ